MPQKPHNSQLHYPTRDLLRRLKPVEQGCMKNLALDSVVSSTFKLESWYIANTAQFPIIPE